MKLLSFLRPTMLVAAASLFAGCCNSPVVYKDCHGKMHKDCDVDVICTNTNASGTLVSSLRSRVGRDDRILVSTFVDLNDFRRTGSFGRIMAETFSSNLTQRGYAVVNVKLRENSMVINPTGEFLLSREVRDLAAAHNAKAALVGTYARTGDGVFVSVRLVRTSDNVIVGSVDYELPNAPQVLAMFGENSLGIYGTAMRY